MKLGLFKIIIVLNLVSILFISNNKINALHGNNTYIEFTKQCLDNGFLEIKPSKYFEITNNEIVFYKWQLNSKYKDQFNCVFEPVYSNSKQVRLNPEKDSFINNDIGQHPGKCCNSFSTNIDEPFQILILDKKKRMNQIYDNNTYIALQLYIIDNTNFENNSVNFFTTRKSKLLSSDVMFMTESYKMTCWKQKKDKFVFDFEKALNPDVLDSEDQKSLENLFLFRYCREPWYHDINETNKALGFINNVTGSSTAVVKGKTRQLNHKSLLLNNKLMYPLSSLSRDLDFSYSFEGNTLKIKRTKENTNEVFSYDIDTKDWIVQKNNKALPLLPRPYKAGNETMIPLRAICELLDARVFWRDVDRSVLIERF